MMQTLIALAVGTALATAPHSALYNARIGDDPAHPDSVSILYDCPYTIGIAYIPEMAAGATCGKAVLGWLWDTGRLTHDELADLGSGKAFPKVACGARLILADGDENKTVAQILEAKYDSACVDSGIM